jgi:cyanophycin synthetase
MTTTSGVFVRGKCVCKGDNTGPVSSRTLLANKQIDAAVLETARGGIVRAGLGYDLADVGVITNITEDHLGLDGIHTLEEMAFVKALVVEAIKKDGAAVLNAEDAMTPSILERVQVRPILFTRELQSALARYGERVTAYFYANSLSLRLRDGSNDTEIVPLAEVPITGGGSTACNVQNCLAAAGALWSLSISLQTIADGLRSFTHNPGRLNYHRLGQFTVMVDYGHNQAGYEAAIQSLRAAGGKRLVGVIGVPGDRMNADIEAVGRLCAGAFQRLYIKEDIDLRGRKPGEVAGLLRGAALSCGFSQDSIAVHDNELDALKAAVSSAEPGDIIAVFYEELEPVEAYLEELKS